jgi:hypothetical protein
MSAHLERPVPFDQPMRLGKEEQQDPFGVLERFFEDYRLQEWREILREMVEVCLTTDNAEFGEAEQRADLLQQYKDLECLLEGAWLIAQHQKGD